MVMTVKEEVFLEHLNKNHSVSEARKIDCDEVSLTQVSQHGQSTFAFKAKVKDNFFEIVVIVSDEFPRALPDYYLLHPGKHGLMGHVNWRGKICYTTEENLAIDVDRPLDVLDYTLKKVLDVLESGEKKNLTSLWEEIQGYWQSLPESYIVYCFFDPGDAVESIYAQEKKLNGKHIVTCFNKEPCDKEYGFNCSFKKANQIHALYIPLSTQINPPLPGQPITMQFVKDLISKVAPNNFLKLQQILSRGRHRKQRLPILFSMPRTSGQKALLGLVLQFRGSINFITAQSKDIYRIFPLIVQRHDKKYLLERGGVQQCLAGKCVSIIGCGAVGSRIADLIVHDGIGEVILVDHDCLQVDNLYRHLLGGSYIGNYKSTALANYFKTKLPYVNITPEVMRLENWIKSENYCRTDIVIEATGNITSARNFNRMIRTSMTTVKPVVYTWLEPYGIGLHALLTCPPLSGCLECLFTNKGESFLSAVTSFLNPGQHYAKDLVGCGGSFTDFANAEAARLALMGRDLAIGFLLNKRNPTYLIYKGDKSQAIAAGLKPSEWYFTADNAKILRLENNFLEATCPLCSGQN
ncbi:Sulfur carrier protein adenylyltransferase ThiF [Desulfovibrio sp. DV]|uniref:ThiF family adenylyltransferase n=1 Tax=Desulfovibrio sp. DV TaxID=1844708 RepID=UPI00094BC3CA|nr:ThiF family adenylyltransferase [Desulfovibrio sp. DV]OLN27135.1 Sulfur carrier protein adenylyltransferase ThiF [Desulfovibrio sp. DV]